MVLRTGSFGHLGDFGISDENPKASGKHGINKSGCKKKPFRTGASTGIDWGAVSFEGIEVAAEAKKGKEGPVLKEQGNDTDNEERFLIHQMYKTLRPR